MFEIYIVGRDSRLLFIGNRSEESLAKLFADSLAEFLNPDAVDEVRVYDTTKDWTPIYTVEVV